MEDDTNNVDSKVATEALQAAKNVTNINMSIVDPVFGGINHVNDVWDVVTEREIQKLVEKGASEEEIAKLRNLYDTYADTRDMYEMAVSPTYTTVKMVENTANSVSSASTSSANAPTMVQSTTQLRGGDTVSVDGKDYVVYGYMARKDGEKIALYKSANANSAAIYYVGPSGKLEPAYNYNSKTWVPAGSYTKVSKGETFNTSASDQKFLEGQINNETTLTNSSTLSSDTAQMGCVYVNINPEKTLKGLLTKRKKYYIRYYDQFTNQASPYDTMIGPYVTKEARDFVFKVFSLTPGQGRAADADSKRLEQYIGSIRKALEELAYIADKAVVFETSYGNLGQKTINSIIEGLDNKIPTVYKNFADKVLPVAIERANKLQKEANDNKRKELPGIFSRYVEANFRDGVYGDAESRQKIKNGMTIVPEDVDDGDIESQYKSYRPGNQCTYSADASMISYYSRSEDRPKNTGFMDLYVNLHNTDLIIDGLRIIINNYVKGALDLIEYQLSRLVGIPNYIMYGARITPEDVNEPLIELRSQLKGIRDQYIYWRRKAADYSDGIGTNPPVPPKPIPTDPPVPPRPIPTEPTEPTPTPTIPPTVPPTEIITQPTTPPTNIPTTPDNHNPNGGGNNYSNYNNGNQASSEMPSEVPVDDVIKKGNTYKLPTSSKPAATTKTTARGNSVIPVLAGLGIAAAAGIGAKTYLDRKKNKEDEEDNMNTEDWSTNDNINIEYQETPHTEETLDYDDVGYETEEKYGAKTNAELEDMQ